MRKLIFLLCLGIGIVSIVNAQDAPKDSTLQEYVGKYKFPDGSVVTEVTVAIDNGALTMASSAGVSALEKKSEDLYVIVVYQGTAKFNRDANKKIIGVSIDAMGYQLEGTKTEGSIAFTERLKNKYIPNNPLVMVQVR